MIRRARVAIGGGAAIALAVLAAPHCSAQQWHKPYSPPCTERENVFEFTREPGVKLVGKDKYEISFAVKANCDVTVDIVDPDPAKELVKGRGLVVRHLASGVLGPNAPEPFQKSSLSQTIYWNGKDDLDVYHKEPEKLRVRVRLGLKPVFDKRLGGTSPRNIPGHVLGIAAGPDGVYVFTQPGMFAHTTIRTFDHDANYVCSLVPPPRELPESKLAGMGYIEYEKGKKALHGPNMNKEIQGGMWLPCMNAGLVESIQPALAGHRIVYTTKGEGHGTKSLLHYTHTDGSTDVPGMRGLPFVKGGQVSHKNPCLAVSPDGSKVYVTGVAFGMRGKNNAVMARSLTGSDFSTVFAGDPYTPGSDNAHFNGADGIDTDAKGRVYVVDSSNNRIQVFSPDGTYMKTIKIDRPHLVLAHKKTGAIYITHLGRVRGKSVGRVTKLESFENPKPVFHFDGLMGMIALDSWSEKPRLWAAGAPYGRSPLSKGYSGPAHLTVWEEQGETFKKVADFHREAVKEAGKNWFGRWNGIGTTAGSKAACDPMREKLYYGKKHVFNLVTGEYEGRFSVNSRLFDEVAFDKRGYMHGHQNPKESPPCAWRVDPETAETSRSQDRQTGETYRLVKYRECPYDYGVPVGKKWLGAIVLKDQHGAKGFQDGFGVNMQGDIVVESIIYYVPKMQDSIRDPVLAGNQDRLNSGIWSEEQNAYNKFLKSIEDAKKRGEEVFFVRREPGIPLWGATIWTFDRNGEVNLGPAGAVGSLVNGARIDEDRALYFVTARPRLYDNVAFLGGRVGTFGVPGDRSNRGLFSGTLVKIKSESEFKILSPGARVPLDAFPKRPPEIGRGPYTQEKHCWVEGAEWFYAGHTPIVSGGCSCPSSRFHLDWYKRTYLPESYRQSIGVIDANGNLIMHLGRYANFDSAPGGKDGCKPGGTDIGMTNVRYIGGTDNYLAFEDWGERIVVLKLNYHAEETVGIE
jgi:hypothetical protein